MEQEIFQPGTLRWAAALVFGFPLLMVLLGEVILRLGRRDHPLTPTLRLVRNLVLPALAAYLLVTRIIEIPASSTLVRSIQTLFWILVIHAALSFVNDVVFHGAEQGSWQARIPKLLLDLTRIFLVAIGAGIVLSMVWGLDLTKVATALGVGSIVLGLALQEPLGNVFAGIMLLIERPIALDDWIEVDGTLGKVVEINWRSVHIATITREIHVIPNSQLNKGSFSNLSRPNRQRTESIELGFSYDDSPNKVKQVLMDLIRSTPAILADPRPVVRTHNYADFAIIYRIFFTVARQEDVHATRDSLLTRVWYAAQRNGLTIPFPIQTEITMSQTELEARHTPFAERLRRSCPQFVPAAEHAHPGLLEKLAPQFHTRSFAAGERVAEEGEPLDGLHLILTGSAVLTVRDTRGHVHEIARLGRGDHFGESALLAGHASEFHVAAVEDLDLLIIDTAAGHALLKDNSRLARELGTTMDLRRSAAAVARRTRGPAPESNGPRVNASS